MPGLEQGERKPIQPMKRAGLFVTDTARTLKANIAHVFDGGDSEVDYGLAIAIIRRSAGPYSKTTWEKRDKKEQNKEIDRISRTIHLLRQGLEDPQKSTQTIDSLANLTKFADEIDDVQKARLPAKQINQLLAMSLPSIQEELKGTYSKNIEMQEIVTKFLASSIITTGVRNQLKQTLRKSMEFLPEVNEWSKLGLKEALIFECGKDQDKKELIDELMKRLKGTPEEIARTSRILSVLYFNPLKIAKEESENIMGILLAQQGLNPKKIVDAWKQSGSNKDLPDKPIMRTRFMIGIGRNIEHLCRLALEKPGGAKLLWEEYGIADFGRYPVELLNEQCDTHEKNDLPYGIIISPRYDWSGAFYDDVKVFEDFFKQIHDKYRLRVVECDGKIGIARALIKLDKRYGKKHKIEFAYIGGHADGSSMDFGNDKKIGHELTVEDLKGLGLQRTSSYLTPNATIILGACKVGMAGGIGPILSTALGLEVIAPDNNSSTEAIHVDLSTGIPKFRVEYAFKDDIGQTRSYIDGIEKENG
ncbi:hypothetical protein EXS71_03725 [Candidatus Uhrbacteria bacterium]|nr:hypothetical protein [Candidatus Uhrbacteria bacterium]